mmetsp:Transcript_7410/g.9421  ORF Transcript_7410/g.9421 Transcript_7410/m.9421 type:complete len:148 (+) Transcript_7410:135-578(+)
MILINGKTMMAFLVSICIVPTIAGCQNDREYKTPDTITVKPRSCKNIRIKESRRQRLCQVQEVRDNCPQTCGICCENDSQYVFNRSNSYSDDVLLGDCSWLTKHKDNQEERITKYCGNTDSNNGRTVRDGCPVSCGFCQDLVVVPPS